MSRTCIRNIDVIYTPRQELRGYSILIEDGRIKKVARDACLGNAEIIDGRGLHATPGLIDPATHIGVYPLEWEWGDHGVEKMDVLTPHLRVVDSIDPFDKAFKEALESGVTLVGIHPGSFMSFGKLVDKANLMPGITAVYRTTGKPLIEEHGIVISIGEHVKRFFEENKLTPTTRMGMLARIRTALRKASEGKDEADPVSEALRRMLAGELAAYVHAYTSRDILVLVNLLWGMGVRRMIVVHGAEAHLVGDELREKNIPVILGPIVFSKRGVELKELDSSNPLKLEGKVVKYALTTDHPTIPIQYLSLLASVAVGEGLNPRRAIESVTLSPAEILGVSREYGSIEEGKKADIALWTGSPLDPEVRVAYTLVEGEVAFERR